MRCFKFVFLFSLMLLMFNFVSAGVGISWDQESALVPENERTCLTYKVYNPWDSDVDAEIRVSDSLRVIVDGMRSEIRNIPAQTSSSDAIPVTFCFKTPVVYEKDCAIGSMFCKQECGVDLKTYEGEVLVIDTSTDDEILGNSGSASQISVSAPLRIRVQCVPHGVSYRPIYIVVALISAILLALNFSRNKKKKSKKRK